MASSLSRPSMLRRLAAGAWHVPHGLIVFVRNPGLWTLGFPAALVTGVFIHLGVVAGSFVIPWVEPIATPAAGAVAPGLDIAFTLTLWLGGLGSGALLGFALGLVLVFPLLDQMASRREPGLETGGPVRPGRRLVESAKGSLLLLAVSALVVPASLAPLTGPFLGAVIAASLLGARGMGSALVRRGLGFGARLAWFRAWLTETAGLGLAALVVLLVPGLNLLLAPILWIGGTDLVREIEEWSTKAGEEPVGDEGKPVDEVSQPTSESEPTS